MGCGPSSNKTSKHYLPNSSPVKVLFNKYDKDKSGKICAKEFYDLCFAMGYRLSPEEVTLDMQLLGDKDGNIEFPVFAKWWQTENRFAKMQWSEKQMSKIHQVREMFDKFDTDQSGKIDPQEFKEMHKAILQAGLTTKPADQALKQIDLDGDGKVDYLEYLKFVVGTGRYHA